MAYLGRQPLVGNYQVLDAITATTTDTYALTKNSVAVFPQTPANCIVSLNGVIQAPFDSYTISGSDIVFASALTGSDSIDFITVLGDVLNVGTVSDGTIGLAKLSATGTKDATTFLRGDNTFASAGGANTPAFSAYLSANQSISHATITKVQFNVEHYDTDSAYDNSVNYRFTVPTGGNGKYLVTGQLFIEGNAISKANGVNAYLYLNNAEAMRCGIDFRGNPGTNHSPSFATNMNLSDGDYLELYARWDSPDSSAATIFGSATVQYRSHFGAIKIIT